jgi:hypothetical protein
MAASLLTQAAQSRQEGVAENAVVCCQGQGSGNIDFQAVLIYVILKLLKRHIAYVF